MQEDNPLSRSWVRGGFRNCQTSELNIFLLEKEAVEFSCGDDSGKFQENIDSLMGRVLSMLADFSGSQKRDEPPNQMCFG